jgi:hypothetical protein
MNILEIYPDYCWWFQVDSPECLDNLREVAQLSYYDPRRAALGTPGPPRAYFLKGDAATFNFQPGTFDRVVICSFGLKRLRYRTLDRLSRRWATPGGSIVVQDFRQANTVQEGTHRSLSSTMQIPIFAHSHAVEDLLLVTASLL